MSLHNTPRAGQAGRYLYAVGGREVRLRGRVDDPELELASQLLGSFLPFRLQPLAMPAPRRHELHEPVLVAVEHLLHKIQNQLPSGVSRVRLGDVRASPVNELRITKTGVYEL